SFRLRGIRGNVPELERTDPTVAREPDAERLRRIAHRRRHGGDCIQLEHVAEDRELPDRKPVSDVRKYAIAVVTPLHRLLPEHAIDLIDVRDVDDGVLEAAVHGANRIERLLVLPPADVA